MTESKLKEQLIPLLGDHLAVDMRDWGVQRHLLVLTRRWPQIVGRLFAEHSAPAFFRGNELWVYASSPILMQQMGFSKPGILAKINELLQGGHPVDDLRCTIPPADFPLSVNKEEVPPPVAVDPAAEREFRAMAEFVADPEVRAALCRLWQRMAEIRQP